MVSNDPQAQVKTCWLLSHQNILPTSLVQSQTHLVAFSNINPTHDMFTSELTVLFPRNTTSLKPNMGEHGGGPSMVSPNARLQSPSATKHLVDVFNHGDTQPGLKPYHLYGEYGGKHWHGDNHGITGLKYSTILKLLPSNHEQVVEWLSSCNPFHIHSSMFRSIC